MIVNNLIRRTKNIIVWGCKNKFEFMVDILVVSICGYLIVKYFEKPLPTCNCSNHPMNLIWCKLHDE